MVVVLYSHDKLRAALHHSSLAASEDFGRVKDAHAPGAAIAAVCQAAAPASGGQGDTMKVLVADSDWLGRDVALSLLSRHADLQVLTSATADEMLELSVRHRPDLVVFSTDAAGLTAADLVRAIRAHLPATRIVVTAASSNQEQALAALSAGAHGVVIHEEAAETSNSGVSLTGTPTNCLQLGRSRREQWILENLTNREREVLALVANGLENDTIARALSISVHTVKNHVSSIYDKIGVATRAAAVSWAWRRNLVP